MRGAALLPKQRLHLGHWISFPPSPTLVPFDYTENANLKLDEKDCIHLLLETHLVPNKETGMLLVRRDLCLVIQISFHYLILLDRKFWSTDCVESRFASCCSPEIGYTSPN